MSENSSLFSNNNAKTQGSNHQGKLVGYGTADQQDNQYKHEETNDDEKEIDQAVVSINENEKVEKKSFWDRFEIPIKSLAFVVGCLVMIASGTHYAFSSISPSIKKQLGYTQIEVNTIGTMANLGTYFGLPISLVNDFAGSRICAIVSGVMFFTGYFLFLLLLNGVMPNHYIVAGLFFLLMGQGSAGGFLSSMSTNLKNISEKYRGVVVGVLASSFGISSAIFSALFTYVFDHELTSYVLFTSISGGIIIGVFGALFLTTFTKKTPPKPVDTKVETNQEDEQNIVKTEDGLNPAESKDSLVNNEAQVEEDSYLIHEGKKKPSFIQRIINLFKVDDSNPNEVPVYNPFTMLLTLDFYLIFTIFAIGAGCGLIVINNLGSIVIAYGGVNGQQSLMVILVSVFNCLGRILFGVLSDIFKNPKYHLTRVTFLCIAMILMCISQYLFAFMPLNGLYPLCVLMGIAYGGIFAMSPSFVSERFSAKYFGMNLSIVNLSAAVGSYAMATGLAGSLYQHEIIEPRVTTCRGRDCFETTFFISTGICCFGIILCLILMHRSRWVYWLQYRKNLAAKKLQ